jgi:hypothetical protein
VVGGETLLEGGGVVIGALDERLARHVILHVLLGRVEGGVVGAARGRVDEAARDAGHEEGVVDLELDRVLELLVAGFEHRVQALGLDYRAGEAIEDESGREKEGKVSNSYNRRMGKVEVEGREDDGDGGDGDVTYPPRQSGLFSISSLIMPITISSLTRPPWSMIFFASRPSGVFLATCDRSMSPVAYAPENTTTSATPNTTARTRSHSVN